LRALGEMGPSRPPVRGALEVISGPALTAGRIHGGIGTSFDTSRARCGPPLRSCHRSSMATLDVRRCSISPRVFQRGIDIFRGYKWSVTVNHNPPLTSEMSNSLIVVLAERASEATGSQEVRGFNSRRLHSSFRLEARFPRASTGRVPWVQRGETGTPLDRRDLSVLAVTLSQRLNCARRRHPAVLGAQMEPRASRKYSLVTERRHRDRRDEGVDRFIDLVGDAHDLAILLVREALAEAEHSDFFFASCSDRVSDQRLSRTEERCPSSQRSPTSP
jgi:hypothetical protein